MPYASKTSGSSSRPSKSSRSPSRSESERKYRVSESIGRYDPTERFFVTGESTRSDDRMARQMKQWESNWANASRRS
ncbi:hypothetical protein F5Y09DRAFT_271338 [Xylaria sp. FL1042]|nr:hypothetical protein F5Y09DRAFT_271338 [Xylaria sp. FL1042]